MCVRKCKCVCMRVYVCGGSGRERVFSWVSNSVLRFKFENIVIFGSGLAVSACSWT